MAGINNIVVNWRLQNRITALKSAGQKFDRSSKKKKKKEPESRILA